MHYALLNSQIPETAWVVHLDEETQPTRSAIKGVCKFIRQEEASGRLRIGQGALLYHREWKRPPVSHFGRQRSDGRRFRQVLSAASPGRHAVQTSRVSIVVRSDVEKATGGFDFGRHGDITEDAFWALQAMQNGLRCAWVEGFLEEQSCMSIMDFLRQRRRWFHGLVKTVLYAPVKLRWRIGLGLNTLLWALAPFAVAYTICKLFYSVEIPFAMRVFASYSFATFAVWYVTGLKANMDEHGVEGWGKRLLLTVLQLFLLPAFCLLEGAGVLWGLVTQAKEFEVVKK